MVNSQLSLFVRFCEARSNLFSIFCNVQAGKKGNPGDVALHSILDMFEFLYMLSATGIDSEHKVVALARAHNAECERIFSSQEDRSKLGFVAEKLNNVYFSEKNIKKLAANFSLLGAIDQSDIARLLFKHMSRETARKVLLLFDQARLVTRIDAGGSVLIRPNGEAERLFEQYLISLMSPPDEGSEDPAKRL